AGDREVAGELSEHERDEQLPDDDDRPRPEERRTTKADPDAEVAERPRRDADEAECDREVREETERSAQFGLDPERQELGIVARRDILRIHRVRHGLLLLPPPTGGGR